MLKGNLKHISYYSYLSSEVIQCLKYLKDTDFLSMENGRYDIIEDKAYANVQDYLTKPEGKFEAHKKYIDIQFIVKGEEKIGVGNIENFKTIIPYDTEKDIEFLEAENVAENEFVELKSGDFLILAPNDAHMPSISINQSEYVKKVVLKLFFQ